VVYYDIDGIPYHKATSAVTPNPNLHTNGSQAQGYSHPPTRSIGIEIETVCPRPHQRATGNATVIVRQVGRMAGMMIIIPSGIGLGGCLALAQVLMGGRVIQGGVGGDGNDPTSTWFST